MLVVPDKVYDTFPVLKTMEKQTIGVHATCSYLDKFGITALSVTVGRNTASSAREMMANLGDGYRVVDVPGLGDEAAMAVTRPEPGYGIAGNLVAELYIRQGKDFLLLAPMRVEITVDGPEFERLKQLALEMLAR